MHPAIPHLIELQNIDLKIATLRADLENSPRLLRELDARLSGARTAVSGAKEAHSAIVAQRKKAELDASEWRERARKYRAQSSAVKTNEAFKALQHEIANADAEIAKAEDRQLEQMMAVEEADNVVKSAEAALREAEHALAGDRKAIESARAEKQKEWDAALAAREKIIANVPEELQTLYARIAKRHHGVVLAEATKEQCRACGMRVLPHIFQELRWPENHEIHTCETCGRILYAAEPAPPADHSNAAQGAATSS
jgi:predicted  nucleic acid-binding Zn-ribbon protein